VKRLFLSWPALICFLCLGCSSSPQPPAIQIVELKDLETILQEHQGKGLLLNFWAIWCAPCVAELPDLMEIAREYRRQGGVVLGISYDFMVPAVTREGVLSQMRDFVRERRLDIPVLIFDGSDYDAINERFRLPGPIPYTLAIDRRGAIVDRHEGQAGKDRFAGMMRKVLGN
jgi:thiol-disulfide isomerase/thioredoxin